ncbi:MAG: helix-turn-helix transcriptional regulator [Gammaproteobacteria bacterium]
MIASEKLAHTGLEQTGFTRRDGLPLEVEVLRLEDLLRPPFKRRTTTPTRTEFHTLLLVESGASVHHVDFEPHRAEAGDLLVIPAGRVQAFDRARAIAGSLVLFTHAFLERSKLGTRGLAQASDMLLGAGARLHLGEPSLRQVHAAFDMLAGHTQALRAQRFADELVASAFALVVFTMADLPETAAAVATTVAQDELVARFEELLEARFVAIHQASAYARALRVSLRTLDRHLLAARGQTTRQLVAARLVLEAKRLLTRREMSVKNVAYELGFSEPANFTRFFRARTGLSPQAFRESLA